MASCGLPKSFQKNYEVDLCADDCDEEDHDDCESEEESDQRHSRRKKCNVEAAIVKVAERTSPVCICGKELEKIQCPLAYKGKSVICDGCGKNIKCKDEFVYHCKDAKNNWKHKKGYDLCIECGDKQLEFDEFRGMLKDDKDYVLQRDDRYPIRCTLQYYKATSNGAINKEIMDDIVKQLEASQKQADFMGSLVTEYNKNRPNEWIESKEDDKPSVVVDEYKKIKEFLQENGGKFWKEYIKRFEKEEVKDTDLQVLEESDLRVLIPAIGPRRRFKRWILQSK